MLISEALSHPSFFLPSLDPIASWEPWRVVLKAADGAVLTEDEVAFFQSVSGGREPPTEPVKELWCVIGRRSGKSRIAAAIAVYEAIFRERKLAAGETGMILCLSPTQPQARLVLEYARGFLRASATLASEIESETAAEIRLRNNITIAVHAASFRNIRGRTILACVYDECAYWRSDDEVASSNPDVEIHRAVAPSLAASGGKLIAISSPYRRTGLLHQKFKAFHGVVNDRVLVIQGESRLFNPLLNAETISAAYLEDPEAASSEWGAEFRSDLAAFMDDELIDQCVDRERPRELPPVKGRAYSCFVDPSGGRADFYCIAIGHRDEARFVLDVIRGARPPFNPAEVTSEYARLAQDYSVSKIVGDNYAGEWVSQAWRDAGMTYERSEMPASQLAIEALPSFARGSISLPDHAVLIRELKALERRTSRSGRDTVSHPPGLHDDHANAVFGALRNAVRAQNSLFTGTIGGRRHDDDADRLAALGIIRARPSYPWYPPSYPLPERRNWGTLRGSF